MKKIFCLVFVAMMILSLGLPAFAGSGSIYCWSCGSLIPSDSSFCPYCGSSQSHGSSNSSSSSSSSSPYSSASYNVGDIVTFGSYEQDNISYNGKEPIEWIVLDVNKSSRQLFLITRYGIESAKYNNKEASVTWDNCTLRSWLNNTFFYDAFSSAEQQSILTTNVGASKNPNYPGKDPGKDTSDKLFILSAPEADYYLTKSNMRKTPATDAAVSHGVQNYTEDNGCCWWWMRNPGFYHNRAVHAYISGEWNYDGIAVNCSTLAVRPVMWIKY